MKRKWEPAARLIHSKKSNVSVNSLISSSAITAVQLPRIFKSQLYKSVSELSVKVKASVEND